MISRNNKILKIIEELVIFFIIQGTQNNVFRSKGMNYNWGIIWQALSPLIMVSGWVILFSLGIRGGSFDLTYFVFLLTFVFGFSMITSRTIQLSIPDILINKKNLNIFKVAFALLISDFIPLVIRFLVVLTALIYFDYNPAYYHLINGLLLFSSLGFFYGLLINAILGNNGFLKNIHGYFQTVLFLTSSIIIPVSRLPESIRNIFLLNPLAHVSEWIKAPTTGINFEYIDITYPIKFLIFMAILSPISFWYVNKHGNTNAKSNIDNTEII